MDEAGGEKAKPDNRGCIWVMLVIVVFAIGATIISSLGEDSGAEAEGPTDAGAIDVCREAVKAKLKAPGTAEFLEEVATTDGDNYKVSGQVDAENSFGAMLRLSWSCDATWMYGTTWQGVTANVTE